jgi:hypothetical protein
LKNGGVSVLDSRGEGVIGSLAKNAGGEEQMIFQDLISIVAVKLNFTKRTK